MVAVIAEQLEERFVSEQLADVIPFPRVPSRPRITFVGADDPREAPRREAALKCWLMREDESARGYALDVSKTGARVSGVGSRYSEGERMLCKLELGDKEPPVVLRCKVVRVAEGEVGVRFLELGFDEWYRLGRFVAGGRAPMRPSSVLMPPA